MMMIIMMMMMMMMMMVVVMMMIMMMMMMMMSVVMMMMIMMMMMMPETQNWLITCEMLFPEFAPAYLIDFKPYRKGHLVLILDKTCQIFAFSVPKFKENWVSFTGITEF